MISRNFGLSSKKPTAASTLRDKIRFLRSRLNHNNATEFCFRAPKVKLVGVSPRFCDCESVLRTQGINVPNPRSGWQHEAWGEAKRSPRNVSLRVFKARGAGDRRSITIDVNRNRSRPLRGLDCYFFLDPGACAPGFMLTSAPRTNYEWPALGAVTFLDNFFFTATLQVSLR